MVVEGEMKTLTILVDETLMNTLNRYLKERGLKKGWFVCEAIKEKMKHGS